MTSEGGVPFGAQHFPQSSSVVPGMSTNMLQTSSYFNLSPGSPNKNPFSFVSATAPSQQHSSLPASNPVGPSGASLSSGYPQQGQVPPWSYPSGTASEPSSLQLVKEEWNSAGSVGEHSNQPPAMSFGEHTSTLQEQMKALFSEVGMAHNPSNASPNSQPFHQQHSRENTFGFPSPPHPVTDMAPHLGHRQSAPAIPVASRLFSGSREQGSDFFSSIPPQSLPAQLEPRSVSQPLGSSSAPSTSLLNSLSPVRGDARHSYHPSPELQSGDAARGSDNLHSGKPMHLEEVMHLGAQPYPPEQPYLSALMNHEVPYSSREPNDSPSRLSRPPSNAEIHITNNQQLDRTYPTNVTNADLSQPILVQSGKPQTNINYPSPHDTPVPTSPKRSDEKPSLIPQQDQGPPQPWGEGVFPIGDQGRMPHLEQAMAKSKGGFGKSLELGVIADLVNLSNGESVEVPSLSSSLNHSVSSLLDSQEDFTQISPCKILPPTPENVLYRAVTPPSGFPLRETTFPSEHQPLAVSASTENQDLVPHQPPEEDKRYSMVNTHSETEPQTSHVPVPFVSHVMTTQVSQPLPQLAPSGTTQVAHPLPQLAPSGTMQVAHPLPQLAPSGPTQVAHPLPQLAPSGPTQVAHPLPQLAPSGTTQVAHPLPQLAPSGPTQVAHLLPQPAPSGTTQYSGEPSKVLPTGLPQSDTSQLLCMDPSPPTRPNIHSQLPAQPSQPPAATAPHLQEAPSNPLPSALDTVPQSTAEVVTQPSGILNPTGFPPHPQSQLATHQSAIDSNMPSHPHQPNVVPAAVVPLTANYQLPTEHHMSTTVQPTPVVYATHPSTVPTGTGNVTQGVPTPHPQTHPPAYIAPVSQPQQLQPSGISQSAPMPRLTPDVAPSTETMPSQASPQFGSQPSVGSVPPSITSQAIPTSLPPQGTLPTNPPPMGTTTSAQALVHPDSDVQIQPTAPGTSVPPQREEIPPSSGSKAIRSHFQSPMANQQELQPSHAVHPQSQPSSLPEPTLTLTSQPVVTQEEGRYAYPPSSKELDHPNARGRYEGHPDERGRYEHHPDSRGSYEGHPDGRGRYEHHPDSRGSYEGHPDGRGRYEGHPDGRGRYEGHHDGRRRYEEHPDERGRYEHHPDGRGRYMYEDPRGYYQTDDPYHRDDHYRSERSRHPSYRDQDPYSHRPGQEYHHRPHSRQPYDYYSDYRHEYGQERRQYDYGRYAYEEDYYGYHRTNPYHHERDGSHYYDERYYDPRYDSQYGGYDYDHRDPEGQQTYYHGYEYPEGSRGYDVQYHAQDEHYSTTHDYNQQSTTDPEASVIYGKPTDQHFEISQMFDSPNTRLPSHSENLRHESTAYPEQLSYYGGDYTDDTHYQQQLYYEGGYGTEEPVWAPIQATPPPPPRETPELFVQPHVRACFGIGGQLVTILPNNPRAREAATVEICSLKDVLSDSSMCEFVEAVSVSPGPFVPGDTPKSEVVRFASTEAEKCRQKSQVEENEPMAQSLEDEALLWDFLVLLCQQNGVVVPSDVAELLMRDRTVAVNSSTHVGGNGSREESLDAFRQLLLAGRKKDALDLACARSLWGHALMLASGMDEQSRTYVVNRFTASLMVTDPLNTFYTLLLGRIPSAVKSEGLSRAGDWRSHLAMILSNRNSKLDDSCIVTLGDSLLSQGRLNAAHLCYHLGQVQFGLYGEMDDCKYTLLGVEHSHLNVGAYPKPPELHKMEVFEYAMSLGKKDFSLPHFQMFKLLHVLKLVEAGFSVKGLKYCEQISYSVSNAPRAFTPTFLLLLMELSANLHHVTCPLGVMENELPSWLLSLQQSVREALSTDYTPSMRSSPSPAFSSVSQTYGNQQLSQPVIGLGQYLTIPSSLRGSSAASSKEGSVAGIQVAVPRVDNGGHQLEIQTTQQHAAEKDAPELAVPGGESGGIAPQQSQDTFVSQYQGNVDMQQYLPQTQNMEGAQQASYPYQQPFLQQQDVNQAQTSEPGTETAIDSQPSYGNYMDYGVTNGAESGVTQGDSSANINTQMTYYGMQPSSGGFAMEGQPEVSNNYQVAATNEQQDWNQEPETPVAKQPMSGDDHVTNEQPGEESEDEAPPEKKEPVKKVVKKKEEPSGRKWSFNILKYVLPRRKNEAYLPDDSDKRIIWDEEKKKWVNLDAVEEEDSGPTAPPTDADLRKPGRDSIDGPPGTGSVMGAGEEGASSGGTNIYSRQSMMRGRLGVRSKYVDVLNPGGVGSAPPPPAPLMMPGVPPQSFSGTFFVPQQSGPGSTFESEYGTASGDHEDLQENSTTASSAAQENIQSEQSNQPNRQPYDQSNQQTYDQSNQFGQPAAQENQQTYGQSNQFGQPAAQENQQTYGQSNQFGQPATQGMQQPYDQSNQQTYDQSNQFGQPATQENQQTYGQSNQFGQPATQENQQTYGQSNQFGQPAAQENQQTYDQSNQFGQQGMQQPYDQSNQFSQQGMQQTYDQSNQFSQQGVQQTYDQSSQFGQPATQGMQQMYDQSSQFGQQGMQQPYDQSNQFGQQGMQQPYDQSNQFSQQGMQQPYDQSNQFGQPNTQEIVAGQHLPDQSYQFGEVQQQQQQQQQQKQGTPVSAMTVPSSVPSHVPRQESKQQQYQQQKQQQQQQQQTTGTDDNPPPPQQPQFFNPSTFGPMSTFPGRGSIPMGGPGSIPSSDSQDDALSTVSSMSELSQEVSRYMSNQSHWRPPTASAGYNRLRQGIRGAKGTYPAMQPRSGQQGGSGRPPPAVPPPSRNIVHQRQHLQQ